MKVLVLGANGQVGRALGVQLGNTRATVLGRDGADLSKPDQLAGTLDRIHAQEPIAAVMNAAAYTAVDQAENDEATARQLNAESPGALARWCAAHDVPFVHYSTDYVFNGSGERPWREDDAVAPLGAYGRTKLEGERAVAAAGGRFLIFRTSWVYDGQGKNFLRTMLKLGQEREELRVVADQIGAPTYAPQLARATLQALDHAAQLGAFPSGIYHLCNAGETSWHGFALAIFEAARKQGIELKISKVDAILASAYPTPAKRPHNSRLSLAKAREILKVEMPDWRAGLKECMETVKL